VSAVSADSAGNGAVGRSGRGAIGAYGRIVARATADRPRTAGVGIRTDGGFRLVYIRPRTRRTAHTSTEPTVVADAIIVTG
jgi:hypothetical protein